jgi:hypothetical protein
MRYDLEESKKIRTNINNWDITDLYGTARTYGDSVNTNSAAMLDPTGDSLPVGLPTPVGLTMSNLGFGIFSQSIMSGSLQNYTQHYGRFTPKQAERLRALDAQRKIKSGSVEVTDLESEK